MSGSKCGTALTFGILEEAAEKIAKTSDYLPPVFVSPRAHKMIGRIRKVYPNWEPQTSEAEVWVKAHAMGLLEDSE